MFNWMPETTRGNTLTLPTSKKEQQQLQQHPWHATEEMEEIVKGLQSVETNTRKQNDKNHATNREIDRQTDGRTSCKNNNVSRDRRPTDRPKLRCRSSFFFIISQGAQWT